VKYFKLCASCRQYFGALWLKKTIHGRLCSACCESFGIVFSKPEEKGVEKSKPKKARKRRKLKPTPMVCVSCGKVLTTELFGVGGKLFCVPCMNAKHLKEKKKLFCHSSEKKAFE